MPVSQSQRQRSKSEGRSRSQDALDRTSRRPGRSPALDVEAVCRRLVEESAKVQEERIEVLEAEVGRLTTLREQDAAEIGRLREEVRFLTSGPWGKGFAVDDFMSSFKSQEEGEGAAPAPVPPDPPGPQGSLGQPAPAPPQAELEEALFPNSIYSRLLLDDVYLGKFGSRKLLRRDKFWAAWAFVFQLASYCILGWLVIIKAEALGSEYTNPSLEIDGGFCYNETQHGSYENATWFQEGLYDSLADAGITTEDLPRLLQCSNPRESLGAVEDSSGINVVASLAAFLLLIHFVVPDVVGAFVALFGCTSRKSKAVAIIVLAEAAAAMCVGGMALAAMGRVGSLDAFLYCVGIAFVHDIDEKIATADCALLALYQLRGRQRSERRLYLFIMASGFLTAFMCLLPGYFLIIGTTGTDVGFGSAGLFFYNAASFVGAVFMIIQLVKCCSSCWRRYC